MRVIERARGRFGDERGATVVIVTILLVAMFGMVALAVDVGGIVSKKREVVRGTDAAALAAAHACADDEDYVNAPTLAQTYLSANVGATMTGYASDGCGTRESGAVTVRSQDEQDLPFAPVLGFPGETDVNAVAHALWGPVSGGNVMPIEFPLSPLEQLPCLEEAPGELCANWYDPSNDHDVGDSSNFGFLNIGPNGVHPYPDGADAACPAAGSSDLDEWIRESQFVTMSGSDRIYVCFTSGHRSDTWYDALLSRSGDDVPETFPVNDPNCMVRTSGKEKACIRSLFTGYITAVYRGNETEAIGTPGANGTCNDRRNFTAGMTLDLDTLSACGYPDLSGGSDPGQVDSITNLQVQQGSSCCTQGPGRHYTYDPSTHVITWGSTPWNNVRVSFDWDEGGSPGACGNRQPDPNAVCVVYVYEGIEVIEGPVCIGTDCPIDSLSRGVRLCDPLGEPAGSPCLSPPQP